MLPATLFTYSARRDTHFWKLVFAGLMAGLPASLLLGLAMHVMTNPTAREQIAVVIVLIVGGVLGLLLALGVVFGLLALRRVRRLRHLTQVGVPLSAHVEELRLLRGKHGAVIGARCWLVFEYQHETVRLKKKFTNSRAIAQAQGLGQLQIALDPRAPTQAAIVVAGQLI